MVGANFIVGFFDCDIPVCPVIVVMPIVFAPFLCSVGRLLAGNPAAAEAASLSHWKCLGCTSPGAQPGSWLQARI